MPDSDDEILLLRVSTGGDQLAAIASLLDVPVDSFFNDAAADRPAQTDASLQGEIAELRVLYQGLDHDGRSALLMFARRLATACG